MVSILLPIAESISNYVSEPLEFEDVVQNLYSWMSKIASYAHVEFYSVVMEAYLENRLFWQMLPELLSQIVRRSVNTS